MAEAKRDKDIVAFKAFRGLRSGIDAERFALTDLALATNIELDETGRARLRTGTSSVYAGTVHSLWSDNELALFAEGASLKQLATDYSATVLDTITVADPISYAKVNDQVYWSNATDLGVIDDGTARSWGLPVPATQPATAGVAGSMPAGVYQYVVTYVRADGQESGAGAALTITVAANGSLTFDVPASADPAVAYKRVYLSTPDGDVLYRASLIANATLTTSYTLDTSEFESGDELETQFLSPPPPGQIVGYFQGAMYVAVGAYLFHSEPHAHELFNLKKYLPMDGDITLFAANEDEGIFVGTTKAVYWLAGNDPLKFTAVKRTPYGAIAGALAYVEGKKFGDGALQTRQLPMWLSAKGVCVGLPGGVVSNLTEDDYALASSGAGAALFRADTNQFLAARSADGYAMNTKRPGLTRYTGWAFNSLAGFNDLYFGANDDGIYLLDGTDDDGSAIAMTIETGMSDLGTSHLKKMDRVWIQYEADGHAILTAITDGDTRTEYDLPATGSTGAHNTYVKIGKGLKSTYWGFALANADGSYLRLDVLEPKPIILKHRRGGGNA